MQMMVEQLQQQMLGYMLDCCIDLSVKSMAVAAAAA